MSPSAEATNALRQILLLIILLACSMLQHSQDADIVYKAILANPESVNQSMCQTSVYST